MPAISSGWSKVLCLSVMHNSSPFSNRKESLFTLRTFPWFPVLVSILSWVEVVFHTKISIDAYSGFCPCLC